ncbi:oxidoreductase [Streptomyces abyssalis]|uniref:Oxidoreductase n=1 Tax=Streptomyces abyssalis TaxID=933944 RepID=A0A1E7JQ33_9ACTN|nr:ferredoxin reductase [Streptomyces abyssalis]OEU90370.1 oxidoreductase [Streptomyces abyssalis]OEU95107.1 oxidoreductase [Streptomyces abyssalis]
MARTAVPGRLGQEGAGTGLRWRVATLVERRAENATASTLVLDVAGWPGHLAGQHVDVRLTAEDGYSAQRSYSLASAPGGQYVEITVQRVADGEVSPYLVDQLAVGDPVELRGPVGGWFVWQPGGTRPVLLIGGGSGVVPLMAMIRARRETADSTPFRLLHSVRSPAEGYYAAELTSGDPGLATDFLYTRTSPDGWPRRPGRIRQEDITAFAWPPQTEPMCYVCGPTGFVETTANLLVDLGHDPDRIRTERFGPSGG